MLIDYAPGRADADPRSRFEFVAFCVSLGLLLVFTLYAFGVFYNAATMEPFYRHADWGHFFAYVIVPTAALVLCLVWAAAVLVLLSRRLLPWRWWWLLLLLWSAAASFVLAAGSHRYLIDIIEMGRWDSVPPS